LADLTTVAAVKAFAGVTSSSDDAAIGGIVGAVSTILHGIVGHTYDATPIAGELHEVPPTAFVILDRPIATVTTVREGGQVLASTGWRRIAGSRLVERLAGSVGTPWTAEISVDYTPASTVPADLELAAREAAAWVLKESGLSTGGSRLGLNAQANSDSGNADYFVKRIEELPVVRSIIRRYGRFA
jgi:hypothetical protein